MSYPYCLPGKQLRIAATASFLGLGWYIGNIAGSANAAREYNEYRRNETLDGMLRDAGLHEYVRKEGQ